MLEKLVDRGTFLAINHEACPQKIQFNLCHLLEQGVQSHLVLVFLVCHCIFCCGYFDAIKHRIHLEGHSLLLRKFLDWCTSHHIVSGYRF
jgi:hypothetical protein